MVRLTGFDIMPIRFPRKVAMMSDKSFDSKLLQAVRDGNIEDVRLCINKKANPSVKDEEGKSALIIAIEDKNIDIAELLIFSGADVNSEYVYEGIYGYKTTPLISAIDKELTVVVRWLLDKNANVEARDEYKRTALICAVIKMLLEITKLLLSKGARVDAIDEDGETAISLAKTREYNEILTMLLAKGEESTLTPRQSALQKLLDADTVQINITELPIYFGALQDELIYKKNRSYSIEKANKILLIECPICGIDYNSNGFEVGYLSLVHKAEASETSQGMYSRCKSGLCANSNCDANVCIISLDKKSFANI